MKGKIGMRIIPSVLTDRLEGLRDLLRKAEQFTDYVQIDFMDGLFVPSKSVSPRDLDGIETLVGCEAHLMVEKPEQYVPTLNRFGCKRIIFHCEAAPHPQSVIERIKEEGMEIGMAINPETDTTRLEKFVSDLHSVLFLSVNPGFYGSRFIPEVLKKIARFRNAHPDITIGIDGGVALDNMGKIKSSGVNYACVGSRIFLSKDPAKSYREFERTARVQT
jgi:ribulose-phosphate 3-epimerase